MLDPEILRILRCPATGQPLRPATPVEKEARGIPPGEEALVALDGSHVYRAVNGLPVLLPPAKDEVSGG